MRALAEEALKMWDKRALIGTLAPVNDREDTSKRVVDSVAGFGAVAAIHE